MSRVPGLAALNRKAKLLQNLRDAALAINDQMKLSSAGDCFIYEGSMNAVELFRQIEVEILEFEDSERHMR